MIKNRKIKELLIATGILVLAALAAYLLVISKPKAKKQAIENIAPLVETIAVKRGAAPVYIDAQGKVEAATTIRLQSEVSGRVIYRSNNLRKGGIVKAGEVLLKVDSQEYELNLAQKRAALSRAKLEVSIEEAKQKVAQSEYDRREKKYLLSNRRAQELARRIPYLRSAQSELLRAQADLENAKINLAKTTVISPINAIVSDSDIDEGELLFVQGAIATLTGLDEFLAEISVPVSDLAYLKVTNAKGELGSRVIIRQNSNTETRWVGRVRSVLPSLGTLGHMARVLVEIKNPLAIENGAFVGLPLLPGARISAKIDGKILQDTLAVPRDAIHEHDRVFLVDKSNHISEKRIDIIRRDRKTVYTKTGLKENDLLVVTKLASIRDGLEVRLAAQSKGQAND